MSVFKRILMYAAMVISIIVMVICIAGIIGAWYYNTPATDAVLDIVVPATEAVQVAEKVTNEAAQCCRAFPLGRQRRNRPSRTSSTKLLKPT